MLYQRRVQESSLAPSTLRAQNLACLVKGPRWLYAATCSSQLKRRVYRVVIKLPKSTHQPQALMPVKVPSTGRCLSQVTCQHGCFVQPRRACGQDHTAGTCTCKRTALCAILPAPRNMSSYWKRLGREHGFICTIRHTSAGVLR